MIDGTAPKNYMGQKRGQHGTLPVPEGETFSSGDIVTLKSGGVPMTVIRMYNANQVLCAYYNPVTGEFKESYFYSICLTSKKKTK